jgi:hypothetical protein
MKSKKLILATLLASIIIAGVVYAADHIDAPAVTGKTTDITDLYVFQGQNTSNMVFVANTQGLLSPASTGAASFDPNTIIQFNIDNNNDNVEDLVIQCGFSNGTMYVYGPYKPSLTGLKTMVEGSASVTVPITTYTQTTPTIATNNGIMAFAGPRDDPFFFDLNQYKKIIGGTATSFNNPGTDAFKGLNVLSAVVEVPKTMLNSTGKINVWATAKRKI